MTLSRPRTNAWSGSSSRLAPIAAGLFLCMLPVTMVVPVLKQLVQVRFDVGVFATHAFMSVNMMGAILFAPLVGAITDSLRRRRTLLAGALCLDALCFVLMRYCEDFTLFMGIRFVEGAAHVTAVSMWMALAADRADGKRSGAVMGIMAMVLMLGTTIGVPLGGIVGRNDPLITFQLGAIFVAAAALVAILFLNEPDERTDSPSVRQSLNSVRSRPILLVPFAYAFIDRFCVGGIISTLTLYMANVLELSRPMIGGLLSLALFPFALLCYPAGRLADRIGRTKPLVFGSLGYGFIFASFGFLDRNGLGIALLISGVLSAVMFAPNLALCRDLAPKNLRTTVFAGFNAAGSLGMLLGPLAGGLICILLGPESQGFTESDSQGYLEQEARSYRTALVLIGMTQLLCVICTLPFLRRVSRASLDEPTTGVRTARGHAI